MDPEQDNPARPQRGFDSFIDAVIGNNDVGPRSVFLQLHRKTNAQ